MILLDPQFWQTHLLFSFITISIMGLLLGSFLNVVIYRMPIMLMRQWQIQAAELTNNLVGAQQNPVYSSESTTPLNTKSNSAFLHQEKTATFNKSAFNLFLPRSHCPHCQHIIRWWGNIPLFSFLLLRGACKECQHKISLRYPIVELMSALIAVFLAWYFGFTLVFITAILFSGLLLALVFIDLAEQLLPDTLTFSLLWLGLICNSNNMFTSSHDAIIGAVSGYLSLWIIASGFKLITGKEGLGLGDCKLLAALGAWMGWQLLPFIVLFASFFGSIYGVYLLLTKKIQRNTPIPFGPFLAGAGWVAFVGGQSLLQWYWQVLPAFVHSVS